jgi:hypothetical protein
MDDAVDLVPPATRRYGRLCEAEKAHDAVDVDEEQWFVACLQQICHSSTDWRVGLAFIAMVPTRRGHQGCRHGSRSP